MPELRLVSIKGKIHEYGPRLELAPHIIYIGRANQRGRAAGGWNLAASPLANPLSIRRAGSAVAAVEYYRALLAERPDLVEHARAEVARVYALGLDEVWFGCWDCAAIGVCHGRPLIDAIMAAGDAR
jgi:hypothetical protein